MGDTLRIEQAPLTDDDLALLRRCSRGKGLAAVFGLIVFLLLACTVLTIFGLALSDWRSLRAGDGLMLLLIGAGVGAAAFFFGRRLLRLPRAWRSIDRALRGACPSRSCRVTSRASGRPGGRASAMRLASSAWKWRCRSGTRAPATPAAAPGRTPRWR
ncbi:hypothetical protein WJ971_18290 [Achromobacter xylosoxidans]